MRVIFQRQLRHCINECVLGLDVCCFVGLAVTVINPFITGVLFRFQGCNSYDSLNTSEVGQS